MEAIIIKTIALIMIFIVLSLYVFIFVDEYHKIRKSLSKKKKK